MTEPTTPSHAPYEVVIDDHVMQQIRAMPDHAIDGLAEAISRLRHDAEAGPDWQPLVPVPVDHTQGRPRTWVPATRSAGYLRDAVAEISPDTVAYFDAEYQQMTRHTTEHGRDGQVRGLRMFTGRWVDYIAIQGDHDTVRHINASENGEEMAARFSAAMRRAHQEYYPDAGTEPGGELGVQTQARPGGGYSAVCPVTQLRAPGATPEEAQRRLRGLLLEWITG